MQRQFLPGLVALALLVAGPAAAQIGVSNPGNAPFTQNPEADRAKVVRKPVGLPGARGQGVVAPAERAGADMPPTEALFDAVNRGDVPAARDAISRGAELEGRNVLGLTPLELAIDLGRNDLTFLLLSLRGAAPAGPVPAAAAPRRSVAAAPRPAPARVERVTPVATAPRQRQTSAAAAGTPVPQAGFLGFGAAMR